jgi:EAL domain-containing protein (putative c-di-GMP-specific phosphodiesterase class I)
MELVQRVGGRYIQGYYFSKPLPADPALKFLEESMDGQLNEWQAASA